MYKGTYDCWKKIAANEGYAAFFKGNLTNVLRSFGCALVNIIISCINCLFVYLKPKLQVLVLYDELVEIAKK